MASPLYALPALPAGNMVCYAEHGSFVMEVMIPCKSFREEEAGGAYCFFYRYKPKTMPTFLLICGGDCASLHIQVAPASVFDDSYIVVPSTFALSAEAGGALIAGAEEYFGDTA